MKTSNVFSTFQILCCAFVAKNRNLQQRCETSMRHDFVNKNDVPEKRVPTTSGDVVYQTKSQKHFGEQAKQPPEEKNLKNSHNNSN